MKKSFVNRRFQKSLLEKESNRIVDSSKIKTIGIISLDEISRWIDIKKEVDSIYNTDAKIFSFLSSTKNKPENTLHFSEKSFCWKGQVKEASLQTFLEEPFDLLIGYFNKKNLYTELAVLHSNAKFKAGISKVNQQLYDIEINEYPKNTVRFLTELKRYLEILNKI